MVDSVEEKHQKMLDYYKRCRQDPAWVEKKNRKLRECRQRKRNDPKWVAEQKRNADLYYLRRRSDPERVEKERCHSRNRMSDPVQLAKKRKSDEEYRKKKRLDPDWVKRKKEYDASCHQRLRSDPRKLEESRTKVREYMRKRYVEKHEYVLKAHKEWRDKNREHVRAVKREYRNRLCEQINASARAVYDSAIGIVRGRERWAKAPRYKALVEAVLAKNIQQFGRPTCYLCLKAIEGRWNLEHKIPIERGGPNVVENLDLAHPSCNASKGRMTYEEWLNSDLAQVRFVYV